MLCIFIKYGVDGKLLKLLRSMYSAVKSCVRFLNTLSDFFSMDIGLFQGEIMSPILFSFFLNDIEQNLQELIFDGLTLDQITIYLLLFADDAILISDTKEGLQRSLNQFEAYCKKWKLTVNIGKTKVMICKKGGRARDEHFTLNGDYANCIVKSVYTDLFNDVINNENTINWVSQVRGLLQRSGFHDIWTYPDSVDDSKFTPVFKQRVRDQYLTVWNAKVLISSSLEFYKEICPTICTATYLHKIVNIRYRRALSKTRSSSPAKVSSYLPFDKPFASRPSKFIISAD